MVDWLGLLTPTQWEALRNWLTTVGGLIALLIAANTYRRNVRFKREEQAQLVYSKLGSLAGYAAGVRFDLLPNNAKVGTGIPLEWIGTEDSPYELGGFGQAPDPVLQATVTIHNGSRELIGPARVQLVNLAGIPQAWEQTSISVDVIEPECDFVVGFTWVNNLFPGQPGLATTLIFRDASGQWWRRHRSEPIELVHDDPENSGLTPTERVERRLNQEALGIPEDQWVPEPKLTMRVRWHRFWRQVRGKTPIP